MECVRKGKGLTEEQESLMREYNVPEWYIDSCKKIKYMFPKAHAAAYVMMAWRVAWCKIHYPLQYYTAYFSIRADGFDYEKICMGHDHFRQVLEHLRKNADKLSDVEKLTLRDMRIAEEMFARGFDFMPLDLYRAKADRFQILDGKIMPSFISLSGMGEKAAKSLEAAAKDGRFLSREDLVQRAKISQTMADAMAAMGLLGDMPTSNQLSFSDIDLMG